MTGDEQFQSGLYEGQNMKTFLSHLRDIAVAGFFALFPIYLVFIVIAKAWKSLSSVGNAIAAMFGMKPLLGVGGGTVLSGLLVITIWIVTGWLVRFSFIGALSRTTERTLSKYIPGYDTYKAIAEEKLQHKVRVLPCRAALIHRQEYWQPGYIIEQDQEGNCVVFLPDIPETNKGHVLLAKQDQVRIVSSITANQLDASLKKMGIGLCSEYRICSSR
jgi:uncharacterized membrane protein